MRGKRALGARKRQEHADEVSARTQQRETRECWSLPPAEHLTTCKAVLHWSRIAECCVPAALSRPCQLLALTRAAGEGALNALNDVLPQKQRGGRRAGMDARFQNQRSLIGCAEAPHGRQPRPGTAAAGCQTKALRSKQDKYTRRAGLLKLWMLAECSTPPCRYSPARPPGRSRQPPESGCARSLQPPGPCCGPCPQGSGEGKAQGQAQARAVHRFEQLACIEEC